MLNPYTDRKGNILAGICLAFTLFVFSSAVFGPITFISISILASGSQSSASLPIRFLLQLVVIPWLIIIPLFFIPYWYFKKSQHAIYLRKSYRRNFLIACLLSVVFSVSVGAFINYTEKIDTLNTREQAVGFMAGDWSVSFQEQSYLISFSKQTVDNALQPSGHVRLTNLTTKEVFNGTYSANVYPLDSYPPGQGPIDFGYMNIMLNKEIHPNAPFSRFNGNIVTKSTNFFEANGYSDLDIQNVEISPGRFVEKRVGRIYRFTKP